MITRLGTDYFKGQPQDIFLLVSTVTTDGELKSTQSGKAFGTCSCKAKENQDGTAVWIAVKSFNETIRDRIARAGKGTPFLAWGRVEKREYNGKEYVDMLADGFLSGFAGGSAPLPQAVTNIASRFHPVEEVDDGELPF